MQTPSETALDNLQDVLALVKCLTARPETLAAIKLRESDEIVVIERGVRGEEGDLVAAHLTFGAQRHIGLGHLTHKHGRARWRPARGSAQPGAVQILGRVLSVIHPVGQNGKPQIA